MYNVWEVLINNFVVLSQEHNEVKNRLVIIL